MRARAADGRFVAQSALSHNDNDRFGEMHELYIIYIHCLYVSLSIGMN